MGEVPSWPEGSQSHSGHLLRPSPAELGPVSEWHHPGQSECSSGLMGLNHIARHL